MARILVLADTHMKDWSGLPPAVAQAVAEADWVVHCGDFTGPALLDELEHRSRNLAAVYGNTDGAAIRSRLPDKLLLDIAGRNIAVIHPPWGGPPWGVEKEILQVFPQADIILYGHTHEPEKRWRNHTLLLNPGQGYATVGYPATYGLLNIDDSGVEARILET
jgi:hypothetical protein